MRTVIRLVILSLGLSSCQTDDFYDTQRYFQTDKNLYQVGDTIYLTTVIEPLNDSKTIKVYKNQKNIDISFALMNPVLELHNSAWTESTGQNLPDAEIQEITITKNKPYKNTYQIETGEAGEKIFLKIRELDYQVTFDKNVVLDSNTMVRIHGHCVPINPGFGASLEEFISGDDIRIVKNVP